MVTQQKKPRVHWTQKERDAFMAAAVTLGYPKIGDTNEVWDRAQVIAGLPPARRRTIDPATAALMNAARKKGAVHTPPKPAAAAAIEPAPMVPPPVAPPEPDLPPTSEEHPVADMIVDTLLRVLYEPRLRAALRNLVAEVLAPETELARVEAVTWRESKLQKEHLPRVVVAGGRTFFRDSLRNIKGVDLRLWGQVQGESHHRLYGLVKDADHCFVITSDIPHAVMHGIKARAKRSGSPPLNIVYWTKPLSELPAAVQALANKDEGAKL